MLSWSACTFTLKRWLEKEKKSKEKSLCWKVVYPETGILSISKRWNPSSLKKEFEVAGAKSLTPLQWTFLDVAKALKVWLRAFPVAATLSSTLLPVGPLISESWVPFWRPFPSLVPSLLPWVTPSLLIGSSNSPLPFGSVFCVFKTTMLGWTSSSSELKKMTKY